LKSWGDKSEHETLCATKISKTILSKTLCATKISKTILSKTLCATKVSKTILSKTLCATKISKTILSKTSLGVVIHQAKPSQAKPSQAKQTSEASSIRCGFRYSCRHEKDSEAPPENQTSEASSIFF
jgi:hypothetical protein